VWFILGDDVRQKDGGVSRDCCIGNFFQICLSSHSLLGEYTWFVEVFCGFGLLEDMYGF